MKKQFSLLLGLCCVLFAARAQKKSIEYGFQGGINLNQVYKSNISGVDNSFTGLSIGANVKSKYAKKMGTEGGFVL